MYRTAKIFPLNILCLGLVIVISVYGQSEQPKTLKSDGKNGEPIQKNSQTTNKETLCDFSAYNTVEATPLIEKQVKAAYPKAAARRKIGGEVKIKLLVNKDGKVEQACAVKGHKLLIPSALAAAKLWQFSASDVQKQLERLKKDYFESVIVFQITPK